eukprot:3707380-Amphidinium_carterae.1
MMKHSRKNSQVELASAEAAIEKAGSLDESRTLHCCAQNPDLDQFHDELRSFQDTLEFLPVKVKLYPASAEPIEFDSWVISESHSFRTTHGFSALASGCHITTKKERRTLVHFLARFLVLQIVKVTAVDRDNKGRFTCELTAEISNQLQSQTLRGTITQRVDTWRLQDCNVLDPHGSTKPREENSAYQYRSDTTYVF